MTTTRATITVEIEVEVSGNWTRAEPDVGIRYPYYEVNGFNHKEIDWQKVEEQYSEQIQEALADARQADKDDDGDARYEAMKDRLID